MIALVVTVTDHWPDFDHSDGLQPVATNFAAFMLWCIMINGVALLLVRSLARTWSANHFYIAI